ncbi:hypothetical protein DV738_g160, partial [Chaetothyriales sp. CBS 135597]
MAVVSNNARILSAESRPRYAEQPSREGSLGVLPTILSRPRRDGDAGTLAHNDDDDSDGHRDNRRSKGARACFACRKMKTRCLRVEGKDACLACSKVNRECVMPGPARKRQKTIHKVAELEQRINALTEALIATNAAATNAAAAANPTPPNESPININDRTNDSPSDMTRSDHDPRSPGKQSVRSANFPSSGWRPAAESVYVDPIERGVFDLDTAAAMFDHYVTKILPLLPALSFPPNTKAEDVRTARPTLFLAILTIGSTAIRPDLHPDLLAECSKRLSEQVFFLGEKSLELVQALLIFTAYYVRSKYAKDLLFNQYIHSAVVMSLELGMGRRSPRCTKHKDGAEEAETRRTWLACYYFASSVAIIHRHPSLVRWSAYIEECLEFFSTSPYALQSDAGLCALARLQHIAEEVSIVFAMDDPSVVVPFSDTKTAYHLKALEKKLAEWKASAPAYMDKRLVEHLAASHNLHMHEIAIQNAHIVGESVGLIKLEGVVHGIESPFRTFFTPDLRVDHYLSTVTQKLLEVGGNGHWPPAVAFSFIMKKLISWHQHRKGVGLWGVSGDVGTTTHHAIYPGTSDVDAHLTVSCSSLIDLEAEQARLTNELLLPASPPGPIIPNSNDDLNIVLDAASYNNINWDEFTFSQDELSQFDSYMNDQGWKGYLL